MVPSSMMEDLYRLGEKSGVIKDEESTMILQKVFYRQIKALIARDLYESGDYYRIMVEDDEEVKKALELLSDPKAYNRCLNK